MTDRIDRLLDNKLADGLITVGDADGVREFAAFLTEAGPSPGQPGYDRVRATRALARHDPDLIADGLIDVTRQLAQERVANINGAAERTALETLLFRIRDLAYQGGQGATTDRRAILALFEEDPERWRPASSTGEVGSSG